MSSPVNLHSHKKTVDLRKAETFTDEISLSQDEGAFELSINIVEAPVKPGSLNAVPQPEPGIIELS